ncbi:MAG TPA: ThuA domain-containing protein [Chthonomonadaceae bacterium]|nr:ThuA domain-containing protein [Chthonomonadaceae bacterium]
MADNGFVRVLVWDEKPSHAPKEVYPIGINGAIAEGLNTLGQGQIRAITANIEEIEQGVLDSTLYQTDVLLWWAHARHPEVWDSTAARIHYHVHERGMGFIALHSAHYSKPFQWVVQAAGHLKGGWREAEPPDTEEITVCAPRHPIAEGISDFTLPREEMYGAPFDVPPPLCLVFQSYFPLGGEYFPSGICWTVGHGKTEGFTSGPGNGVGEGHGIGRVFYFRPGHETFPTYYDATVRRILYNAVLWCAKRK